MKYKKRQRKSEIAWRTLLDVGAKPTRKNKLRYLESTSTQLLDWVTDLIIAMPDESKVPEQKHPFLWLMKADILDTKENRQRYRKSNNRELDAWMMDVIIAQANRDEEDKQTNTTNTIKKEYND